MQWWNTSLLQSASFSSPPSTLSAEPLYNLSLSLVSPPRSRATLSEEREDQSGGAMRRRVDGQRGPFFSSPLLFVLIVFLLSSSVCALHFVPKITSPHSGFRTVEELLEIGRNARPYVIEWESDEEKRFTKYQRFLVGPGDPTRSFGKVVTVEDMAELLADQSMKEYVSPVANTLLKLAEVKYLRITDEYKLGGECFSIRFSGCFFRERGEDSDAAFAVRRGGDGKLRW
jgi:hypothetical protein